LILCCLKCRPPELKSLVRHSLIHPLIRPSHRSIHSPLVLCPNTVYFRHRRPAPCTAVYELVRIFNRTNLTTNISLHNRVSPVSLTLRTTRSTPNRHKTFADGIQKILSLVQLCTILNYNTQDQITTHPPSAYTQGSTKIKH
jgi:hypothetical protein